MKYKSFRIRNFRCFKDIKIENFRQVNLISGMNNVGKTALLEALWLHHGYYNPELGARVDAFRGIDRIRADELMWNLFHGFDTQKPIELVAKDQEGKESSLTIKMSERPISAISPDNEKTRGEKVVEISAAKVVSEEMSRTLGSEVVFFEHKNSSGKTAKAQASFEEEGIRFRQAPGIKEPNAIFLAARAPHRMQVLAERLFKIDVSKELPKIIGVLNIVEPSITDLRLHTPLGTPMIYGDVGTERLLPLPLMGDGLGRLLNIALAIPDSKNAILLVDEIENGLHHSIMAKIWLSIAKLIESFNVQLFATTHSWGCIQAAHEAFSSTLPYDFCLYRLEWIKGRLQAVSFDKESLAAALKAELEVR